MKKKKKLKDLHDKRLSTGILSRELARSLPTSLFHCILMLVCLNRVPYPFAKKEKRKQKKEEKQRKTKRRKRKEKNLVMR